MLTERERIARGRAEILFRTAWEHLSDISKQTCLAQADEVLMEQGVQLASQDKEAAKTWGGDIDLVSFEGE